MIHVIVFQSSHLTLSLPIISLPVILSHTKHDNRRIRNNKNSNSLLFSSLSLMSADIREYYFLLFLKLRCVFSLFSTSSRQTSTDSYIITLVLRDELSLFIVLFLSLSLSLFVPQYEFLMLSKQDLCIIIMRRWESESQSGVFLWKSALKMLIIFLSSDIREEHQ